MENSNLITGWRDLQEYTGRGEHTVKRWVKHCGFPQPIGLVKRGRCNHLAWEKDKVDSWLKTQQPN